METKDLLHVEVCLKPKSFQKQAAILEELSTTLNEKEGPLFCHSGFVCFENNELLSTHVKHIKLCEFHGRTNGSQAIYPKETQFLFHLYQYQSQQVVMPNGDDDTRTPLFSEYYLPSLKLEGLWERLVFMEPKILHAFVYQGVSLVFEDNIPGRLLDYIMKGFLFSDKNIDYNIISWNKLILLYGPPGTGKTSLCLALSQKIAIRLSKRYKYGKLVEVHAHSLFSKWFSESGKLINDIFVEIHGLLQQKDSFICLLIDEVETICSSRFENGNNSEPKDAMRAVNVLLTHIDKIKNFQNIVIMCTSNLTEAIDDAFLDRADIKQYIGLPSVKANYSILHSCIEELEKKGLLNHELPNGLLDWRAAYIIGENGREESLSTQLFTISKQSQGLSARALKKITFLAFPYHKEIPISLFHFLECIKKEVETQQDEKIAILRLKK